MIVPDARRLLLEQLELAAASQIERQIDVANTNWQR
jgi:hypothetical protein